MKAISKIIVMAVLVMFVHAGGAFALEVNEDGIPMDQINKEKLEKISEFLDFLYLMKTPEKVHSCLRSIERMLRECKFEGPTVNLRAQEFLQVIEKAKVTALQETEVKLIIEEVAGEVCDAYARLTDAFENPPLQELCFGLNP